MCVCVYVSLFMCVVFFGVLKKACYQTYFYGPSDASIKWIGNVTAVGSSNTARYSEWKVVANGMFEMYSDGTSNSYTPLYYAYVRFGTNSTGYFKPTGLL